MKMQQAKFILIWISALLSGCSVMAGHDVIPDEGPTVSEVYQTRMGTGYLSEFDRYRKVAKENEGEGLLFEQRSIGDVEHYSSRETTEIKSNFKRVYNPDVSMYVFPHLAGKHQVVVPGYKTNFPMYDKNHYALPGEVTEP